MTATSIARSICRPLARSVAGAGDGGWTPSQLTNVLQRMDSFAYASSNIDSLPVVESSVGTSAVPRGQRCVLFDGVDDFATRGARVTSGSITALTVSYWLKRDSLVYSQDVSESDGSANGWIFGNQSVNPSRLQFYTGSGGITSALSPAATLVAGSASHVAWVFDGSLSGNANRLKCYVNGIEVALAFSGTIPAALTASGSFNIGWQAGSTFAVGKHWDVRIYGEALSASRVLAIFNQASMPTTIDRTGLLAAWWLNEESGTTHYDWSGNGRNLTATNVTQSTYHATDSGVRYNAANELGYTLSGAVVIPRNEANPTQDAAGGALGVAGQVELPGVMEVPCLTVTGTEFLAIAHLTGSETVVSSVGTSTPSIAAGRINLTAGTISSILLSDGTRLPLQDGPGSSNTNRTCYNVDGTGRHATLTNGTVATMWAGRLNTVRDWCLENGGSIAANGAFVPGRIGSNLDAAGNTKGIAAGVHGNPYSRFVPNNWSAPSLVNIGSTASDLYAPSGMAGVQAESTADTRYANQARYLATREALTGSDKTNAEGWVA